MKQLQKLILNGLHYSGLAPALSPVTGGLGGILMLHRVNSGLSGAFSPNAHLTVDPRFLDQLFMDLKRADFDFVSMDKLAARLGENRDRETGENRMVAVTLDDGYRDNLENAVPVFKKHDVPFTIYVAPGLVDGRAHLWWEDLETVIAARNRIVVELPKGREEFSTQTPEEKQRTYLELMAVLTSALSEEDQRKIVRELAWLNKIDPEDHRARSIMSWKEISQLAADPLCTIGAHTIHHYAVARLLSEKAHFEMRESANIIEAELGAWPKHFAYPYGYPAAAGKRDFDIAKELGFLTAVTTRHGVLFSEHEKHLHALPRISLNGDFQQSRYVKALMSGLPTRLQNKGKRLNVA